MEPSLGARQQLPDDDQDRAADRDDGLLPTASSDAPTAFARKVSVLAAATAASPATLAR
jgi:hypothetical protein